MMHEFGLRPFKNAIKKFLLRDKNNFYSKDNFNCFYYKHIPANGKQHICIFQGDDYLFLEYIRPVLVWLKENAVCYITVVFLIPDAERRYVNTHRTAFDELNAIVDTIILYQEVKDKSWLHKIGRFKFARIIEHLSFNYKVDTVLFSDSMVHSASFGECIHDNFSHSIKVCMSAIPFPFDSIPIGFGPDYYQICMDYLIVSNQLLHVEAPGKRLVIPAPKFDYWWVQRCKHLNYVKLWRERIQTYRQKTAVCLVARFLDPPNERLTLHDMEAAREVLHCLGKEFLFVFKFHPNDNMLERKEFINRWIPKDVDWVESEYEAVQLATIADVFLVIGFSSVAGDVLPTGIPVITLYNRYESRAIPDVYDAGEGGKETIWDHYHLGLHADNASEAIAFVSNIDDNWRSCFERVTTFFPSTFENSSAAIGRILSGTV